MKNILIRYFLFVYLLGCISCNRTINGSGAILSETRDLNQATSIKLSIPAQVTLIQADSFSCVVGAQKNILEVIKTSTSGDVFTIDSDRSIETDKPVQIVISLPNIEGVEVTGSGQVSSLNSLHTEELKLEVNGSGTIKLNGKIINIRSDINGSGEIFLEGKCDQQKITITGSGDFHGYNFESAETKVEITGSGDAEITVTNELNAEISGSGNVNYKGSPHLKSDITGSGNVQKK